MVRGVLYAYSISLIKFTDTFGQRSFQWNNAQRRRKQKWSEKDRDRETLQKNAVRLGFVYLHAIVAWASMHLCIDVVCCPKTRNLIAARCVCVCLVWLLSFDIYSVLGKGS